MSSAYIKTEPEVTALGRSLVYKANNVGPSTSTLIVVYFSLFQHKLVVSCNFLSIRIVLSCFYLLIFYFEKFSTWICRLPFAVYVMLKLSLVPVHKNAKTGTNFPSIQPATFIGLLIRPDASFFFLCYAIVRGGPRGTVQGVRTLPWDDLRFSNTTGILPKKTTLLIGVEEEQETSAPLPKKNPGSAPDSKVRPQWPIILREFYVICRSWNLKRNVGPKTKDFVTEQFYPKLTTFCRLCRSILVIFWDYKFKFISRTLSL